MTYIQLYVLTKIFIWCGANKPNQLQCSDEVYACYLERQYNRVEPDITITRCIYNTQGVRIDE